MKILIIDEPKAALYIGRILMVIGRRIGVPITVQTSAGGGSALTAMADCDVLVVDYLADRHDGSPYTERALAVYNMPVLVTSCSLEEAPFEESRGIRFVQKPEFNLQTIAAIVMDFYLQTINSSLRGKLPFQEEIVSLAN